jgi:hypothetical protein
MARMPQAPSDDQGHETLAVRARGISKCFGEVVALDSVDLDIPEGQVHGLVGLPICTACRPKSCIVYTSTGDVPNPLWQFNGSIDLLAATSPR